MVPPYEIDAVRFSRWFGAVGLAAALLTGQAVAAERGAPGATCPNTGLKTVPMVLVTAKGKFRYTLEVASTESQQACGMMFRKSMAPGKGMFFEFSEPRSATFWMENTPLPLDIIFVKPDNRVLSVTANAKPLSRMLIDSGGVAAAVIELNAGQAARIGLKAGDRLIR